MYMSVYISIKDYLRVENGQGAVVLVRNDLNKQFLASIQLGWIRERFISNFVQRLERFTKDLISCSQ